MSICGQKNHTFPSRLLPLQSPACYWSWFYNQWIKWGKHGIASNTGARVSSAMKEEAVVKMWTWTPVDVCLSKTKKISIGDSSSATKQSVPWEKNVALQMGLRPSKISSRRKQNCVTETPQIVEISIEMDSDLHVTPETRLARRDSYSWHDPWGGKKKCSCSTKTQSSLDADKKVW